MNIFVSGVKFINREIWLIEMEFSKIVRNLILETIWQISENYDKNCWWFLNIYKFKIKFINNNFTLNGEFEDEYEADFTKGFKQEGDPQDAPAGGKCILAVIVLSYPQLLLKDNFWREEVCFL